MQHATTTEDLRARVEAYLRAAIDDLRTDTPGAQTGSVDDPVDAIFRILTSQQFGYLGRSKSEPYRASIEAFLRRDVAAGVPVRFDFDIGPGYHASIRPGDLDLSFDVGLAELMILRQVALFCAKVGEVYAPGASFHLVIDNLCGLATNDIPLERTNGYVQRLRALIDEMGVGDRVSLLVESEVSCWDTYRARLAELEAAAETGTDPSTLDEARIDNVARFLGRSCEAGEAARRMDLYQRTGTVTEELLAPAIHGVRMTQRHSAGTIGFRSFPGGAQRLQAGELGLLRVSESKLRPILVTSRNAADHELIRVDVSAVAPASIGPVLVAIPRG